MNVNLIIMMLIYYYMTCMCYRYYLLWSKILVMTTCNSLTILTLHCTDDDDDDYDHDDDDDDYDVDYFQNKC
jgi:hypothetical protein